MLTPDLHVACATDVSVAWLRERGVRGLLIDADDTLVVRDGPPLEDTLAWLDAVRAAGIAVALLSNGSRGRVAELGASLGVPAFALSGKPFGFAFRRGLRALGTDAASTAMIGDQLFTDVLGANCAGLTSVLVTPLSPGRHAHTRAARRLERWVLAGGERGRPLDR
ncbi:MAG: YqeG family HAD IIIA-type phosphatase [Trueperaceae bacterium]|nr:YqeG family HAD IIIA-type phosphatase [Trueperaceae bacterium]